MEEVENRLVKVLSRHLLLDLTDMSVARARQAHEIIRDNTQLQGKSARGAEGQIRFRIMEQGFQEICEHYGAILLEGGLIEGSDLRIFQPFMRFGDSDAPGIVLGLASMPLGGELPTKNMSRTAGVALNYRLTPRLALDKRDPQPGDIFVLFLVARDPAKAGQIEEIAVGIIDAEYQSFLFYETIEKFMARYAPPDQPVQTGEAITPQKPLVRLKGNRTAFKPPEDKKPTGDTENNSA